jgi:hypothetical protein
VSVDAELSVEAALLSVVAAVVSDELLDELVSEDELPHAAKETTIADAKSKDNAFFFISYLSSLK